MRIDNKADLKDFMTTLNKKRLLNIYRITL